jgi:hypothetical protein
MSKSMMPVLSYSTLLDKFIDNMELVVLISMLTAGVVRDRRSNRRSNEWSSVCTRRPALLPAVELSSVHTRRLPSPLTPRAHASARAALLPRA